MKTLSLIGYGKMSKALICGLVDRYTLEIIGRDWEKLEALKAQYPKVEVGLLKDGFDIDGKNIILCVKPHALDSLLSLGFKGKASSLYSILAGTPLQSLKKIAARFYIRAMPNVCAKINSSATTLTGDEELKSEAMEIFSSLGSTTWLESEKELDIATALAGSGPAFLALVAQSLEDGAVREGLRRDIASKLTSELFLGSAKLLKESTPNEIKESVMSPGGTTAEGIYTLEEQGVRASFMKCIKSAYEKSQELKKS